MNDTHDSRATQALSLNYMLMGDAAPIPAECALDLPDNRAVALFWASQGKQVLFARYWETVHDDNTPDWTDDDTKGRKRKPLKERPTSTDPAQINAWWDKYPDAIPGLSCDDFIVLDVDTKQKNGTDGEATLAGLGFFDLAEMTPTRTRTKSNGWHLFFAGPEPRLKNWAGRLGKVKVDGLDIRCNGGGWVVAPGAYVDGKRYRPDGAPLGSMPLPAFPKKLLDMVPAEVIERAPVAIGRATEWQKEWAADRLEDMAAEMREAKHGSRHNTQNDLVMQAAGYGAHGAITEQQARDALLTAAIEAGRPAGRAESTFANAWRDGLLKPLALPHEPIEVYPSDFDDLPALVVKADPPAELQVALEAASGAMRDSETGALLDNLHNHTWALRKMLKRKGWRLRYDEFSEVAEWNGEPLDDASETALRAAVEQDCELRKVKKDTFHDAISLAVKLDRYHPIRDYLDALKWDGIPRLDSFLPNYFRSKDDAYTRGVGRCFLIAMVARIMRPGCKHDCALILTGGQGAFKSTAAQILAGGNQWFSANLPAVTDDAREARMHLPGKWVVELGEMSSLNKSTAEAVKAFVSGAVDKVRLTYGRRDKELRRQCVFIGTSNNTACLRDETGNRRFWPVEVGDAVDIDALARDRDQLFAEAVEAFNAGEQWHLTPELDALARVEQEAARDPDIWEDTIRAWLDAPEFTGDDFDGDVMPVARDRVKLADVLKDCLSIDTERQDRKAQNRVTACLRAIGWKRKHERDGKWWVRP